jgi:hypothetical protein
MQQTQRNMNYTTQPSNHTCGSINVPFNLAIALNFTLETCQRTHNTPKVILNRDTTVLAVMVLCLGGTPPGHNQNTPAKKQTTLNA